MKITAAEGNFINWLKCILCIGVVFIHSQFIPGKSLLWRNEWQQIDYSWYNSIIFLLNIVLASCVPLFFIISGYLYFLHNDEIFTYEEYKSKSIKRVRTLLVPYMIGNMVAYVVNSVVKYFQGIYEVSFMDIYTTFIADPVTGFPEMDALWFIRDLIVMCILSPIIYYAIKKIGILFPLFFFLWWSIGLYTIPYFFYKAIIFFSLGAYFAINQYKWFDVKMYKGIYVLLFFLSTMTIMAFDYHHVDKFVVCLAIPLWVYVTLLLSKYLYCPKRLVTGCFFVYLFHWLYFTIIFTRIWLYVLGTSVSGSLVSYILGAITNILFLLVVYRVLLKVTPSILSCIVGGRL